MRLQPRYKQFSKSNPFIFDIPQKVNTFKQSKWKNFQTKTGKRFSKNIKRKNPLIFNVKLKSWEKIKKAYKEGLNFKNAILTSFDNSITATFLKKQLRLSSNKSTKSLLLNCLIKPYYRIDILLAQLFFFKTVFHARQSINEGEVLVNSKKIKGNVFLKQGDIISFVSQKSDAFFYFNTSFINNQKLHKFYSFLEYDLYTQTIVIVKNFEDLSWEDLILLIRHTPDLNLLKNYL